MRAMRCSSVILAVFIWAAGVVVGLAADLACSLRDEFFAFVGILPVMYRWALPAPFFIAGNRRAMTDVPRGMIAVSSSYSNVCGQYHEHIRLTEESYLLCHLRSGGQGRNLYHHQDHS